MTIFNWTPFLLYILYKDANYASIFHGCSKYVSSLTGLTCFVLLKLCLCSKDNRAILRMQKLFKDTKTTAYLTLVLIVRSRI